MIKVGFGENGEVKAKKHIWDMTRKVSKAKFWQKNWKKKKKFKKNWKIIFFSALV